MANLSPSPKLQFFDANGNPLAGGKLYTYAAGTTTPLATYTDSSASVPNTNPVILDSRGEAEIWLGAAAYKLKLTTSTDVEIWTVDDVVSANIQALADLSEAGGSALVGFLQAGTGAVTRTVQSKLRDVVSVKDFGAVGDGIVDDSNAINAAATAANLVKATTGTYLYKAATTANPAKFEFDLSASCLGMTTQNVTISVKNKENKFIGFQHNYNEIKNNNISNPITTGNFVNPPISDAVAINSVDVLAYWYNDFGLEATRAAGGALGSTQWYTWQWNHTDVTTYGPYDPQRHPLLGWYRGDNSVVLDWICYWLKEAGVAGVVLSVGTIDTTAWNNSANSHYWVYQLFNNVPNFKTLKYAMSGPSSGTQANFEAHWTDMKNNVMATNRNYHVTTINGKTYPTIYLYDMATIRTSVFASNANFETWMKGMATYFQGHGHDGVCILGRNASYYTGSTQTKNTAQVLNDFGVYVFETDYGAFPGSYSPATVFSDYVNQYYTAYDAVKFRRIPNVMTGRSSKFHPSGWTQTGTTPALFQNVLQNAINLATTNDTIPNIVTIYNVSEWGEGGASLQPNMQDGFGYLNAIRQAGNSANRKQQVLTDVFTATGTVKTGNASDAVAFSPFIYTVTSPHSVSKVEVEISAKENTGNYAYINRKWVFALVNTSGTLSASSVNSDAASAIDRSSANYSITPSVAVSIVNATTATVDITLTKGGALGWSTCEYVVKTNIISTDPAFVA